MSAALGRGVRPDGDGRVERRAAAPAFDYRSEGAWAAPPPPASGKLDGAIVELRSLKRRIEFTGVGVDRLPGVITALRYLKVAARVDSARCLRAVVKAMTLWKTNPVVMVEIYDLFSALDGLPKTGGDDDDSI